MEHFTGGEMERKEPTPELQIVPGELPQDEGHKFPDGITNWPDIGELDENDPLPGEKPGNKPPPTLH